MIWTFLYLLYCVINFCVKLYFFIYLFIFLLLKLSLMHYKNYITNIFDMALAYKGCHDTFFFFIFFSKQFLVFTRIALLW